MCSCLATFGLAAMTCPRRALSAWLAMRAFGVWDRKPACSVTVHMHGSWGSCIFQRQVVVRTPSAEQLRPVPCMMCCELLAELPVGSK